ncbi:MAG: hypothetical protein ACTH4J_18815 [Vibrio toranzoniae]|uniref:hypothetical protein n=1 Tax=Vibrio toranzoniae TaxID=1194427 RepID=UPI003F9B4F7B
MLKFIIIIIAFTTSVNTLALDESRYGTPKLRMGKLHHTLDSESNFSAERVYNDGEGPAFVTVSVIEVLNPGNSPEEHEAPEFGEGPIITPRAFVIPPDSSKSVRIITPNIKRNSDKFYRIRFVPVKPTEKLGFSKQQIESANESKASVNVSFGWGLLYIVPKSDGTPIINTNFDIKTGELNIANSGDSMLTINHIEVCDKEGCKQTMKGLRILSERNKFVQLSINNSLKSLKIQSNGSLEPINIQLN